MDSANHSTNGTDYTQQSETAEQSMDQTEEAKGSGKPGEQIYASKDQEDDRKLFVGGLAWDTTNDSLKKYFSAFGDVVDCDIKKDPMTQKPRGFGFVLFSSKDSVSKVLAQQDHQVDGKSIDPKPAIALKKPEKKKKIFIGGIGPELKDEQIVDYFSQFGTVVESEFPEDKNTKRRFGFGFVTYETSDEAQAAQTKRFHHIGSRKVEVSEAVSREERQHQKSMRGGMMHRRGRGGNYGPNYRYGGYGGYDESGFYGPYGGGGGGYGGNFNYGPNHGGGYQGYGGSGYDYGPNYSQYGGGYGDYSGGHGGYGYGNNMYGSGGGYSGYEQSGHGKAPVNRRGGSFHHPYSR
ncbi:heterogeneous nuclear ribonucleoprotein A/B-like isoform X1 [Diadema antillarum]|uniref:heterogeneous nuclear ribonucleoprotein A/B-like isoform X1 n=1 Tax=Diadema antillarum TaxID=105358 RepID=UPI003A8AAA96